VQTSSECALSVHENKSLKPVTFDPVAFMLVKGLLQPV